MDREHRSQDPKDSQGPPSLCCKVPGTASMQRWGWGAGQREPQSLDFTLLGLRRDSAVGSQARRKQDEGSPSSQDEALRMLLGEGSPVSGLFSLERSLHLEDLAE